MLDLSKIENVYLAPGATDLRKSIDGCSNIVQYQMFLDPFSPSIFIFCNRIRERFPPLKLILSKIELVCIIDMAPFLGFVAYIIKELFLYEKFTQ